MCKGIERFEEGKNISVTQHLEQANLSGDERAQPGQAARLMLILGGARSGKSAFAEQLASSSGKRVAYIATASGSDEEMRERIVRHRRSRPADWQTVEEPLDLAEAVRSAGASSDVLLLDCMTLWLSNWMAQQPYEVLLEDGVSPPLLHDEGALRAVDTLLKALAELGPEKVLLVISNEVGLGIVPPYQLGRVYRDTLGYVNQRLAKAAERVYLMVAGLAVDIKLLHHKPLL